MANPFGATGMPAACETLMKTGTAMGSPEFAACMGAMQQNAEAEVHRSNEARQQLLGTCSRKLADQGFRIDGAQDEVQSFRYIAVKDAKEYDITTSESCSILRQQKLGC